MTNQETVYPYALTTLARVKDRLSLKGTDWDSKIIRWINSVTDFVQTQCGGRQFVKATYTNEQYSPGNAGENMIILRNTPVWSVSSLQFRTGPNSAPTWSDFLIDNFDILNPRQVQGDPSQTWYPEGLLRVYGALQTSMGNSIRVTYVAGYPVDWPNAGNGTTHLLPADLTDLAENLVVRRFKRRELAGMASQGLENANTSWRNAMDQDDLDVIDTYTMAPIFL